MNKLLEKIKQIKQENPYVRVCLGASKGKDDFMWWMFGRTKTKAN